MPHAKVEIEEVYGSHWNAEVECGGLSARRVRINASSAVDCLLQVAQKLVEFGCDDAEALQRDVVEPVSKAAGAAAARAKAKAAADELEAAKPAPKKAEAVKVEPVKTDARNRPPGKPKK